MKDRPQVIPPFPRARCISEGYETESETKRKLLANTILVYCKQDRRLPLVSFVSFCEIGLAWRSTVKEAAPNRDCLFVNCALRCLELLDHSDVHEPSQVIIGAARISNGVAKLESKHRWRVLTPDIVHTHGNGGVVQDILPARHGVRNRRRRFLLLAYHFLATLGSRHVRSTSARLYAERREFFIEEFNKLLDDRFVLQIPGSRIALRRLAASRVRFRENCACPRRDRNQTISRIIFFHRGEAEPGVCVRFCGVDASTNSREPR